MSSTKLNGAADAATDERPHPGISRQLEQRCFEPARSRLGKRAWQAADAAGAAPGRDQASGIARRQRLAATC